jgi:hypothetical protein
MNASFSQADMQSMMNRLMRLIRLDTTVFDEVRLDAAATIPSVVVAAASMLLMGIGGWLWWMIGTDFDTGSGDIFLKSTILGAVFAMALWLAWVFIVYLLLTQVFRAQADVQQLVRTMGLATVPLALSVFMFIPMLGFGVGVAALALTFGLTTMAIQAATNASPAQSLVANIAGFAVWAVVLAILAGDMRGDPSAFSPGVFIFGMFGRF